LDVTGTTSPSSASRRHREQVRLAWAGTTVALHVLGSLLATLAGLATIGLRH
jgi:hypothetical protein